MLGGLLEEVTHVGRCKTTQYLILETAKEHIDEDALVNLIVVVEFFQNISHFVILMEFGSMFRNYFSQSTLVCFFLFAEGTERRMNSIRT